MELTKEAIKTVLESLIFTVSGDACLDSEKFDSELALELAVNLSKKLEDDPIDLACYLYKGNDEFYEEEISNCIEESIPQIRIKR